jgi:hypothetical protein
MFGCFDTFRKKYSRRAFYQKVTPAMHDTTGVFEKTIDRKYLQTLANHFQLGILITNFGNTKLVSNDQGG